MATFGLLALTVGPCVAVITWLLSNAPTREEQRQEAMLQPNPADYPGQWVKPRKGMAYRSAERRLGLVIPTADNAKYARWYLSQLKEHAKNNPDEFH